MKVIPSLRVSVTSECNLSCVYCHKEGQEVVEGKILTPWQFSEIVKTGTEFGVRKVKITGGEPLLRQDINEIVAAITSIRKVDFISLTTNGILLEEKAGELKRAGLKKINVSLDTLRGDTYEKLTGSGDLRKVLNGIKTALYEGLEVELNSILLKGVNDSEVPSLLEFARKSKCNLQLIELVKSSDKKYYTKYHLDLDDVEGYLKDIADNVISRRSKYDRPLFIIDGIKVGICRYVKSPSECSGNRCNGLRVTSDGYLRSFTYTSDRAFNLNIHSREHMRRSFSEALENLN